MVEKLMKDNVKADESELPRICALDWEFDLSSIFVEVDTPLVNINTTPIKYPLKLLLMISILYYPQGRYGTRSTAALTVKTNGEVTFYETYLDKDSWKDRTVSYQIQKQKPRTMEPSSLKLI